MSRTVRDRIPSVRGVRVLALAAALLVAACGDQPAPGSEATTSTGGSVTSSPEPSTSPSATDGPVTVTPGAGAATELTIVVDNGSGGTTTWRLTCDPAGGDHPTPDAACAALAKNGETALPPVPKDRMCTQQFGGPDKATVTGTWRGAPVNATFSKTNGCEIGRWRSLAGLLPALGA
jgi:hypothetical protein